MLVSCLEGDKPIQDNLQNLQSVIKDWKLNTLDVVLAKKRKLMSRIGGIQNRLQNGGSFYSLRELEKNLQLVLSEILRQEELMWFQRSRAKWLADGDRNTRYYHLKVINRRRRNNIVMLRNDQGNLVDDPVQLQGMVNFYYQDLFSKLSGNWEWVQTTLTYPSLDLDVLERLACPIENGEIKKALFGIGPWKAPGPDGYPAGFYQQDWNIVGNSIIDFVKQVWVNPNILGEVNYTNICLIPKTTHPEFVNQFRPISLCNTLYKIVSKVIVNRLKECIPTIVSPINLVLYREGAYMRTLWWLKS
jgi:hypothetical protein